VNEVQDAAHIAAVDKEVHTVSKTSEDAPAIHPVAVDLLSETAEPREDEVVASEAPGLKAPSSADFTKISRANVAMSIAGLSEKLFAAGDAPKKAVPSPVSMRDEIYEFLASVKIPSEPAAAGPARPVSVPKPAEASTQQAMDQCSLAAEAHQAGKLDEAIACYRRALEFRPDLNQAREGLAATERDKRRLIDALAAAEQAVTLRPDDADAHFELAQCLQRNADIDRAIESYRTAVRLRPRFAEAFCKLANTLRDKGKIADAKAAYRQALSLQADLREAQDNLLTLAFRRERR
jgi:tetratricopeptide (TPR) repeat protein